MTKSSLGPAIAMLTNWAAAPEDVRISAADAFAYVDAEPLEAIHSLFNLATILLSRIEVENGMTPAETLQDIAIKYSDL